MNTAEKLRFLAEKAETGEEFLANGKKARIKNGDFEKNTEIGWVACFLDLAHTFSDIPWVPKDGELVWRWNECDECALRTPFQKTNISCIALFNLDAIYRTKSEAEQKGPKRYEELLEEYNNRLNHEP